MPKQRRIKKSKKNLPLPRLGLAFIILGLILLCIPSIFYLHQTIQLKFFTPQITPKVQETNTASLPIEITIPQISLRLPIGETSLHNNSWEIYEAGVSHLDISSRPGGSGTIILYAHNTTDKFGPILWLKKNNEIIIKTQDEKAYKYIVTQTLEVDPQRVDLFNQTGETLILYTCTGFADLKRFLIIAQPAKTS